MKEIKDVLKKRSLTRDHRNSHEFQAYGNRLADELGDQAHRALYIRLAKKEDRSLLEIARDFVMTQENVTTKGRLFMWKLSELKKERKEKEKQKTKAKK